MKKKKLKEVPEFRNEDEEREFWWTHDSTDYFDWDKAERVVFPNLKMTTRTISHRLPESVRDEHARRAASVIDKNVPQ